MSRTPRTNALDRPLTADDLIEFWRLLDQSLSEPSPQRPLSGDATLVLARWATGICIAAMVMTIGPLLRAVGGA